MRRNSSHVTTSGEIKRNTRYENQKFVIEETLVYNQTHIITPDCSEGLIESPQPWLEPHSIKKGEKSLESLLDGSICTEKNKFLRKEKSIDNLFEPVKQAKKEKSIENLIDQSYHQEKERYFEQERSFENLDHIYQEKQRYLEQEYFQEEERYFELLEASKRKQNHINDLREFIRR